MNEIINILAEYERLLANPAVKEDLTRFFSDEFVEIGSSGKLYNREQTLKALESSAVQKTDLSEFNLLKLGENTCLLTYKAKRTVNGKVSLSYRSSVWNYNNKQRKIIFHQGTNIAE